MSLARSIEITPALQPIPPRLKVLMLPRSLYLFTIMAERDGVGLNKLEIDRRNIKEWNYDWQILSEYLLINGGK